MNGHYPAVVPYGRVTAASLLHMDQSTDTNAAIWKSEEGVQYWAANADERERKRAAQWRFMGELLPFGVQDAFTFLDLGAGTGGRPEGSSVCIHAAPPFSRTSHRR